jgi:hypothetical protein
MCYTSIYMSYTSTYICLYEYIHVCTCMLTHILHMQWDPVAAGLPRFAKTHIVVCGHIYNILDTHIVECGHM